MQIFESIGNEVIEDLRSVRGENMEAVKYATVYVKEGHLAAEKARRMTRNTGGGGSTPYREKNFGEFSLMVDIHTDFTCYQLN